MRPLRRWVPAPARRGSGAGTGSGDLPGDLVEREKITAKDLVFCAEFAVHGGVAVSSEGFRGEGELLRMQRCGLLDLERDPAPPFAVTRVALSAAARDRLSGAGAAAGAREAPSLGPSLAPSMGPSMGPSLRRGFEVARGMISAAVKTELAAWRARGGPGSETAGGPGGEAGGGAGLETRLMTRISRIEIPFGPPFEP